MAEILVRRVRPSDAEELVRVHEASIRALAADHYSCEHLEAWVKGVRGDGLRELRAHPPEGFVAAEIAGRIAGFGYFRESDGDIHLLYVDPAFARQGVGARLLQDLEALARKRGREWVGLNSSLNAVPFYTHQGYRATQRTERRLPGATRPIVSIRMEKRLARP